MKHLLTILCVLTSFTALAQFPNTHTQSNPYTKEVFNGSVSPKKGLVNGRYADTAAANLDYVAGEAGAQIIVGNTIYLRDNTATKWIVAGGYGVIASNITILNDSSISICNGITCDTFNFTNIVVNNFSVVNDSTILVCDGNNVCDTLFIPPTPISKNFVDSTKIRGGDSLFYYINGNEYLGGVISPKSTISILNDSSLVICSSIKCDTFTFNNIVINSFTVVNDSTILVCDGNNVCDTLNIPPTPIAKSYVDSTKIIDGVIYYYINGNAYSGGAVTTSAQYQWSVLDSLNTVASPAQGDVYLVGTAPSGSFVGHANQIAQYDTTAGFTFTMPNVGDLLYNSTTYQVSKWTGTAWVLQPPPLVENWWSRVAWNGAPGQYIQTGAKNSYLTMFGSLNGSNTGLGRQVFTDIPSGGLGGNTAIGNSSQFHIGAGAYNNTSVGHYSLWYSVSGHDQVAIGYGALNTGNKVFSIGLGTNAANNNNTFSISDSTTHLHMKLDSASGVAPSVVGKDANGNWHTYKTPAGGSGSVSWGDITGLIPDQIDLQDSLNNKVNKTDRFPLNVVKPIKAIDSVTIGFDSLNLTEIRYSQAARDTATWTDSTVIDKKYFLDRLASYSPGGGSCDTCIVHFALSSDSTKLYPILQNGDSLPYINWLGTTVDTLPLHNQITDLQNSKLNKSALNGGTTNQVLTKNSSTDQDYSWKDPTGTGGGITAGSIAWPGTLYSTPTTGSVVGSTITFTPSLASQSAYTIFGRGSGSGTPSFLNSLDSNWIPSLHSEAYYNTKYTTLGSDTLTQTLTDGATITFNATLGKSAKVTLGGNRTLSITNMNNGMFLSLLVIQDATGSRTLTLPASTKVINGGSGVVTLSTTASSNDILTFWKINGTIYCNYGKNYN